MSDGCHPCIVHTSERPELKGKTWCGRTVRWGQWTFVSIDHAAYTAKNNDRLMPCKRCVASIAKTFKDQI